MASSYYACSIRQGFNFEKDQQYLVGHLVSMTIGSVTLAVDQTLTIPTTAFTTGGDTAVTAGTAVVAVISSISWQGGYADPLYISCQLSNQNQKAVSVMLHTNLLDNTVVFQFNIYAYDAHAKVYYLAFHSNATDVNGLIYKQAGDLSLSMDPLPHHEVVSPMNFQMQIGIMPQPSAQVLCFAVSNTDKFAKTFGVAVAGT
ncbi:MAG: hypothetical protein RI893_1262 [Pseudomonadota bacterium]|jgi:hypothetical protein